MAEARRLVPTARQEAAGETRQDTTSWDDALHLPSARVNDRDDDRPAPPKNAAEFVRSLDPRNISGPKRPMFVLAALALIGSLDVSVFAAVVAEMRTEFAVGVGSIAIIAGLL